MGLRNNVFKGDCQRGCQGGYLGVIIVLGITLFSQPLQAKRLSRNKLLLSQTKTLQQPLAYPTVLKIALFDTSRTEAYRYNPILRIAAEQNIAITYYPVSALLDATNKKIPYGDYDGAFFMLSPEFLKTLNKSPLAKKILNIIARFSHTSHKITGLLFPSIRVARKDPVAALAPLFSQLGITPLDHFDNPVDRRFKELTNRFLQLPLEYRPINYHTTLRPPSKGREFGRANGALGILSGRVSLLPLNQNDYAQKIKNLFPFGIYWFNQLQNNHVLISSASLFSFSGISENFKLCPISIATKSALHLAISDMMGQLHALVTNNTRVNNTKKTGHGYRQSLPSIASLLEPATRMKGSYQGGYQGGYQGRKEKLKTAWMELTVFKPSYKKPNKKEQQDALVDYILASDLDHLWITINPQMYYSPIGTLKKEKTNMLRTLALFTKKLAYQANYKGQNAPGILIGFEIANNIYKPNLPTRNARDLYGNKYPDIPAPLEQSFWENEVKRPLALFLNDWHLTNISHGIRLSGVVLDLEMYGRKTTASFLPTMGFAPETVGAFLGSQIAPAEYGGPTNHHFAQYLITHKQGKEYFTYLERRATKLGMQLRDFFNAHLPQGEIVCYAPNISTDWFYKGLYKGLSSKHQPLHLFTFNTAFQTHKKWLTKNDIHAYHSQVLMLSKLTTREEASKVRQILAHHDGIWINRFSRLVEPYHKDWSELEQTPLAMDQRRQMIEQAFRRPKQYRFYLPSSIK